MSFPLTSFDFIFSRLFEIWPNPHNAKDPDYWDEYHYLHMMIALLSPRLFLLFISPFNFTLPFLMGTIYLPEVTFILWSVIYKYHENNLGL